MYGVYGSGWGGTLEIDGYLQSKKDDADLAEKQKDQVVQKKVASEAKPDHICEGGWCLD